tara:strand:+ start:100 stop:216 length:117 start_codon:yes stop_codon:yes gene_type:complete
MSDLVATGQVPDMIAPLTLEHFWRFDQFGERGTASVGH